MENENQNVQTAPAEPEKANEQPKPKKLTKKQEKEARLHELSEKDPSELSSKEQIELVELVEWNKRAKGQARIRNLKKRLAKAEREAVDKVFEAEGIKTENDAKEFVSFARAAKKFGFTDGKDLFSFLEKQQKEGRL